jgi:hypothetical protein
LLLAPNLIAIEVQIDVVNTSTYNSKMPIHTIVGRVFFFFHNNRVWVKKSFLERTGWVQFFDFQFIWRIGWVRFLKTHQWVVMRWGQGFE